MTVSRLALLERFARVRVLVVGDVMLDEYLLGDVRRVSPEAPVPVVTVQERQFRLGGAGNVARNVAALGAIPVVVAAVGDDAHGATLERLLHDAGIEARLARVPGRATTHKVRVLARHQHVVRFDEETDAPLAVPDGAAVIAAALRAGPRPDVLLLSDYAKGVLAPNVVAALLGWAQREGIPAIVDPKREDFTVYRGATFVTPNTREAAAAAQGPAATREDAVRACRRLLDQADARGILLTRSEDGMALVGRDEEHFVAAHRRTVYDVTGAGDTVAATFAVALAAGAEPVEAMALANLAAAVVVGKMGAATCTRDELAREAGLASRDPGDARLAATRLLEPEEAARTVAAWRAEGRRVVLTNGCFDVLHAGHVVLLEEARARGDALVVAINADDSVRRLKGEGRPVNGLLDRARVLAALRAVDAVVAFAEDTPLETVLRLRPDVLVKGGDYREETIVGAREVRSWGGDVVVVPLVPDRSTSAILSRGRA
jgi:D-beta-D-heptose 7-phosphate kinase / D-beta-D-heptose 1-phosphate adenosyltransferase